jgi:hypothetical protein
MPELLDSDRVTMSLAEGVPTVELRDVEASGTQGWSFLNRATMLVGDEGFLVRRLERDGADLAPPGWDDAVASHGSVAVIASGTRLDATVIDG